MFHECLSHQHRVIASLTECRDILRITHTRLSDPHNTSISDIMTPNGKHIAPTALAVEAVELIQKYKIQGLLVLDDRQHLQGVLNFHDLLQAGVV